MTRATASRRSVLRTTAAGLVGAATLSGRSAARASGPTVYAVSNEGVLHAVDAASGEIAWTADHLDQSSYPGGHVSAPTVVDGTVFVGSVEGRLHAIDAVSGEDEWTFVEPDESIASDPTVVDGTVYVGADDATLYAVDAATGDTEWTFDEPSAPVVSAPQVVDGTVFVGSNDTNLYAVDAATGDTEWTFDYPTREIRGAPTVAGSVYVQTDESVLYSIDPVSGEWEWIFDEYEIRDTGSPVVADGTVFTTSGSGGDTVHAIDAEAGTEEWSSSEVWNWPRSPTYRDGTLYAGHRELFAMDAETGDVQWSHVSEDQSQYGDHAPLESLPTVHDGTLYGGAETGRIFAVDATNGEGVWTNDQPGAAITGAPTIVAEPDGGDSVGSRVTNGVFGHTDEWASETAVRTSSGASNDGGSGSRGSAASDDELAGPGVAGSVAAVGSVGYLLARRQKTDE